MRKFFILLATAGLILCAGCAPLSNPDLPSGSEQQLDHPATLSGTPPGNPLDVPDEATLPAVPGQ